MTIIESVRQYLEGCPLLKGGKLKIDFLPTDAQAYSLDVVPSAEIVKTYLDGSAVKQLEFVLASRNFRTESVKQNVENLAFYEDFARWVREQARRRNLPTLDCGRTARKLETTTPGYFYVADDSGTARYQIQMKLTYVEKGSRT